MIARQHNLQAWPLGEVCGDILIGAVGYESRSTFVWAEHHKAFQLSFYLSYESVGLHSFDRNKEIIERQGAKVFEQSAGEKWKAALSDVLESLGNKEELAISLDVSSIGRELMAELVSTLLDLPCHRKCKFQFLYAPAAYEPPDLNDTLPIDFNSLGNFGGWTSHPERPLTIILGLGYEPELAFGALESMDPNASWAFLPIGKDKRYEKAVVEANKALIDYLHPHRIMNYQLATPARVINELSAFLDVLLPNSRVVLIPGGPKIFTLTCLLLQYIKGPECSVWRMSTHRSTPTVDHVAAGQLFGMEIKLTENIPS